MGSLRGSVWALSLCCGCNAVLGIAESAPRSDASVPDSADSGVVVSPASCGWVLPQHRKIADLSGKVGLERTWIANIQAETLLGSTRSRVVTSHPLAGPLEVFTVDELGPSLVPAVPLGTSEIPLQTARFDDKTIGVLSASRAPSDASPGSKIVLYRLSDGDPDGSSALSNDVLDLSAQGDIDKVIGIFAPGNAGETTVLSSFAVAGADARLVAGTFDGNSPATAGTLVASGTEFEVYAEAVLRVGTRTFAFAGEPGARIGASQFAIADGSSGPFAPRALGGPNLFLVAAGADGAGKLNFVFIDSSSGIKVLFGQIDPGQVETFLPSQFFITRTYGGLSEVPFTSKPRWSEDRLLDIGPTGKDSVDLKLLWGDPFGGLIVEQVLESVSDGSKIRTATASVASQFGQLGGILNVFWVQTYVDATSEPYDVLFFDQARCL